MINLDKPLNFTAPEYINNKFEVMDRLREERPVHTAKISVMKVYTVARYDDCAALLKDPRVLRNRSTITGGSRFPFPMPKSVQPLIESMIQEDDPNHRRLRNLVRHAFKPQAIKTIETNIDNYSNELLDGLEKRAQFDLNADYAVKIPVRMIADMLGVEHEDMPHFQKTFGVLTKGFGGLRFFKTLFRDLPKTVTFAQQLIDKKRDNPADDILTGLIHAEEDGDRLSHNELLAMVFLLIVAGYETTVHLICNGVHTLLEHPESLAQLKADPELINSAVEEILRYRGPIQSTKPGFAAEDITLHGITIPKGKPIMPMFAAANHDPRAFDNPKDFDITRTPNHHLGFGHGIHFCMGAHLARAEARIGIANLINRLPDLRLAVPSSDLKLASMPGWHRYESMPLAASPTT